MLLLHELAHVYQHRTSPAFDDDVRIAHEKARKAGRYDNVAYCCGSARQAYAMTNSQEYFAELTEAYFGRKEFYSFDRAELIAFDPDGAAMIARVWNDDEPRSARRNERRPGCRRAASPKSRCDKFEKRDTTPLNDDARIATEGT